MGTCGGLAVATGKLVAELIITFFGRYRCHQRIFASPLHSSGSSKGPNGDGLLIYGRNPAPFCRRLGNGFLI